MGWRAMPQDMREAFRAHGVRTRKQGKVAIVLLTLAAQGWAHVFM